jgi:PilZ domain-containing protein
MTDRRASRRIPGSALPWLTAFTTRAPALDLLDISSGGALIASPTCLKPGEREVLILHGEQLVKVVGWVVRTEVTRLAPSIMFRSALRFAEPVSLPTLASNATLASSDLSAARPTSAEPMVLAHPSRELREEFTRVVRGLADVLALRVSPSIITRQGKESVYFAVPDSSHGEGRLLQVFFASRTLPSAEQFIQMRHLAVLASGLPDLEMIRSGPDAVFAEENTALSI